MKGRRRWRRGGGEKERKGRGGEGNGGDPRMYF